MLAVRRAGAVIAQCAGETDWPVGAAPTDAASLSARNGDQREVYYRPAFPLIVKALRVFVAVDTTGALGASAGKFQTEF